MYIFLYYKTSSAVFMKAPKAKVRQGSCKKFSFSSRYKKKLLSHISIPRIRSRIRDPDPLFVFRSDPDPLKNLTDPKHWFFGVALNSVL